MTILCTGSVAYDYLMSFPGYFRDHIIPEKLETISPVIPGGFDGPTARRRCSEYCL